MSKANKNELSSRMKEFYENRAKTSLIRRMPVAIRIDGKAFRTFTKGFTKPYDMVFVTTMQDTMKALCENIQGCVLGYTQSDEITLILVDYEKLDSAAYCDYDVQKICSITSSMATMYFNKFFIKNSQEWEVNTLHIIKGESEEYLDKVISLRDIYEKAIDMGAMFDSRCFNIPKEEVTNLIFWRQLDASRNSVSMAARAYFSTNELHNKTISDRQEMLYTKYGINWNDYPTDCKRGSCCIKNKDGWIIDKEIPIFKGEDRNYIEELILLGE